MKQKLSYSFLALSLSCFGIPLYVHLASFYFNRSFSSLALIGSVIFFCRLFDVVFDPVSGYVSDFLIKKNISRSRIILCAAIPLFIAFYLVFNPTVYEPKQLMIWLGATLLVIYFFFSLINVNYEAMISSFGEEINSFIAAREFFQLVGILLISILPSIISYKFSISYDETFSILPFIIAPLFFVGVLFLNISFGRISSIIGKVFVLPKNENFWKLAGIYVTNSIGVAIPAVLIRFYVDIYLKAPHLNGLFLGLYFLSAAISVFIWAKIINKIGQKKAWTISIVFSIAVFVFAGLITSQTYYLFYLICLFSGLAVGCDLVVPQSILVKLIENEDNKTIYFAIFSMITKISLAFATLVGLGLITKENGTINYSAIPFVYALVPCFFKLITVFWLKKL